MPKQDRALCAVQVKGAEPIRARLGAGREALVNSKRVRLECLSGLNLNVRNVAVLEIPAALLRPGELKPGNTIELNVSLATHGRAYSVTWDLAFHLARMI